MAVIYLRHPAHGEKVASSEMEAAHDREHGWEDFDPTKRVAKKTEVKEAPKAPEAPVIPPVPVVVTPEVPAFLAPAPVVPVVTPEAPVSDLPADFPGREELIAGGLATWASVVDATRDQLLAIKGIGPKTADAILEKMAA